MEIITENQTRQRAEINGSWWSPVHRYIYITAPGFFGSDNKTNWERRMILSKNQNTRKSLVKQYFLEMTAQMRQNRWKY